MTLEEDTHSSKPLTSIKVALNPIGMFQYQGVDKTIPLKVQFWMLPDRRIYLLGRTLHNIRLPKDAASKIATIRMVAHLYFPCLQAMGSTYIMNQNCFIKRERQFDALHKLKEHQSKLKLNNKTNLKYSYLFARKNSI